MAGVALGVLDLTAFGAEMPDDVGIKARVVRVKLAGQRQRDGPDERAAMGAGLIGDGPLLQHGVLVRLHMGMMPVVVDGDGPGGTVMAAGGAQAAGILPDGDGIAGSVLIVPDMDGPGRAGIAAHAATHAKLGIDAHRSADALRRKGLSQREGIRARPLKEIAEKNLQKEFKRLFLTDLKRKYLLNLLPYNLAG